MNKIPFTIKFPQTEYTKHEVSNFREVVDESRAEGNFQDEDQRLRYLQFLEDFENKKIKPQSEIDEDIFWLFMDDVENRASIDYLEEHYDIEDEPEIVNGGKYFYKKGQELRRVYQKYSNTNWGKLVP